MKKALLTIFAISSFAITTAFSQSETLFTVGDTKVKKSEFEYIYKKNNFSNKADFSKKSLDDYLNLYVNFRLKVKEAMAQGLDTGSRFKEELTVYEKQLLESYVEKDVLDKLVKQEFERSKTDVQLSHIFFSNSNGDEQALEKANEAYAKLKAVAAFSEVAKTSDDKSTASQGGKVGWMNSYQMTYPQMEEIAYSLKTGAYAKPVKTQLGYHIIQLDATRPARPKIKAAIIKRFLPIADTSAAAFKQTEDSMKMAYAALKSGAAFEKIVERFSEDDASKSNKGELDWFGINTYAKIFEETAYALQDGEYSLPFKTKTAWYIVKRVQTAKPLTIETATPILKTKLPSLPIYQYEMDKFIQTISNKFSVQELTENINSFKSRITVLANTSPFKYRDTASTKPLLKIGNSTFTENDFGKKFQDIFYTVYPKPGAEKFDVLYKNTLQAFVIDYYKQYVKENNAEYKSLMDEYKNGIMIFALSENNIWNKASSDSVGLLAYYKEHQQDFNLKKRASVRTISAANSKQINTIYKLLLANPTISDDSLLTVMKSIGLTSAQLKLATADSTQKKWNINKESLSLPKYVGNSYTITQVYNLQAAKTRHLDECRGYVVAAYQESIEQKWLAELRLKYPVVINKAVLNAMVKKP